MQKANASRQRAPAKGSPTMRTSSKPNQQAKLTKFRVNSDHPMSNKSRLDVYGAPVNTSNPVYLSSGPATRVRHREMVNTYAVPTATDFPTQLFISQRLNPANVSITPWLSRVAKNYEKYRVHNMKITIVSNNATTTGGWLAAGVDRDSSDPIPGSKQDLMNLGYARGDAVWSGFEFDIPADDCVRFVDSNVSAPDQRLVDFGKLYIAAFSSVTGATVDVYVSYDVTFYIPSSSYTNGQIINTSRLWTTSTWNTGAESFGPGFLVNNTILGAGFLQFSQPGQFLITTESEGTTMNAGGYTVAVGSNVTTTFTGGAENSTRAVFTWLVTVVSGDVLNSFIRYTPNVGATITRTRLYCTPISSSEFAKLS